MQFNYSIDSERGMARVVVTGEVSVKQAQEVIETVSRDPRWQPGFCRLVDMREARISFSKGHVRELAGVNAAEGRAGASKKAPQHRVALVTRDALSFGIASQYAAFSELQGVPTEVFKDMAAAEAWLAAGTDASIRV
jgi:hypothetical protein